MQTSNGYDRYSALARELSAITTRRNERVQFHRDKIDQLNREYDHDALKIRREMNRIRPPETTTETTVTTVPEKPTVKRSHKRKRKEITLEEMRKTLEAMT